MIVQQKRTIKPKLKDTAMLTTTLKISPNDTLHNFTDHVKQ